MGYSIFDETMVDMPWPEIEKAAEAGAIVLLPIGIVEAHGPHMGSGVDIYLSYIACKLARRELEANGIKTLIAPPYYWGINNVLNFFPGSFSVRKETLKAMLYDILASLKSWGFNYVFNVNLHGDHDHNIAIMEAVKEVRSSIGLNVYHVLIEPCVKRFGLSGKEEHIIVMKFPALTMPNPKYINLHADFLETSVMANYFPDQVNGELARTLESTDLTHDDLMVWRRGGDDAKKLTPRGYFGDPASFDPQAGKKFAEDFAKSLANSIETFIKGNYEPPQ